MNAVIKFQSVLASGGGHTIGGYILITGNILSVVGGKLGAHPTAESANCSPYPPRWLARPDLSCDHPPALCTVQNFRVSAAWNMHIFSDWTVLFTSVHLCMTGKTLGEDEIA